MSYNRLFFRFLIVWFLGGLWAQAQELPDDDPFKGTEEVDDHFQAYFFEALKQKAIGNAAPAIDALQQAEGLAKSSDQKGAVFFELGKNFDQLNRAFEAEDYFQKALEQDQENQDVLKHLFEFHRKHMNVEKAIALSEKIKHLSEEQQDVLATFYVHSKENKKALELIEKLDVLYGKSETRTKLLAQITALENPNLESSKTGETEASILKEIQALKDKGNAEKAHHLAEKALEDHPNSEAIQTIVLTYYLQKDNQRAVAFLKELLKNSKLNSEEALSFFQKYLENSAKGPNFELQLQEIVELTAVITPDVFAVMAAYLQNENQEQKAVVILDKALEAQVSSYSSISSGLQVLLDLKAYREAEKKSAKALEFFPAQAFLYYVNGRALLALDQVEKAIVQLEMGLDFLVEDSKLEKSLLQQLASSYRRKGNTAKAEAYAKRAEAIK